MLLFVSVVCVGQANKTLQDSIFQKGDVVKLPNILFYTCGPYFFTETQKDSIKLIADFLKTHKNYVVEISNHTDNRGTEKMNLLISNERSEELKHALIRDFGIDSARVANKGYGETKPIISEAKIAKEKSKERKEELHAINRRCEMKILEIK